MKAQLQRITREIPHRGVAYLIIRRCPAEELGLLLAREVRTLAEQGAKALSPKALTGAAALTEQLRTACGFYVGPGHMAGWLGAGLAQLCR